VWTSLLATVVLVAFWPLVRKNLKKRGTSQDALALNNGVEGERVSEH